MVTAARAAFHHGSVAYFLARLAATLGDHRAADELYADAARRDDRAGAAVWVARDLRRHAELLLAHEDNDRGQALAQRAAAAAEAAGLKRTLELITGCQGPSPGKRPPKCCRLNDVERLAGGKAGHRTARRLSPSSAQAQGRR